MDATDVITAWADRVLGAAGTDLRAVWHLTHPTLRTHLVDELLAEISPAADHLAGDGYLAGETGPELAAIQEGRVVRAMEWASVPPPDDHLSGAFFINAALRIRRPFESAGFLAGEPVALVFDVREATVAARAISPSGSHGCAIIAELLDGAWLVSDVALEVLG